MTRIWSIDWWKNPAIVIEKVEHFLKILLESEEVLTKEDVLMMKPIDTLAPEEVFPEANIWFGDQVFIKDTMTKETFDIRMDGNPANKDLMNAFKRSILGKGAGELFEYEGFEYQVVKIKKKKKK